MTSVVLNIVNHLRNSALIHRQFVAFLKNSNAPKKNISYYCKIRWLSIANVCERVYELKDYICTFLQQRNDSNFPELHNDNWLNDFAFTVAILKHLNALNLQLQGKNLFVHDMHKNVIQFIQNLGKWHGEIEMENLESFPNFNTRQSNLSNYIDYLNNICDLHNDFCSRFLDFELIVCEMNAISSPFSADVNNSPIAIQLDLIELQANRSFEERFQNESIESFYNSLDDRCFKNIKNLAKKMFSIFGSTYICESTFSKMKFNKSKYRSSLTNDNLTNVIRISTCNIEPNFDSLLNG